jgi:hypothetical protein
MMSLHCGSMLSYPYAGLFAVPCLMIQDPSPFLQQLHTHSGDRSEGLTLLSVALIAFMRPVPMTDLSDTALEYG